MSRGMREGTGGRKHGPGGAAGGACECQTSSTRLPRPEQRNNARAEALIVERPCTHARAERDATRQCLAAPARGSSRPAWRRAARSCRPRCESARSARSHHRPKPPPLAPAGPAPPAPAASASAAAAAASAAASASVATARSSACGSALAASASAGAGRVASAAGWPARGWSQSPG
eukprot:6203016-Pleurochrysis_carterae.AAC.1